MSAQPSKQMAVIPFRQATIERTDTQPQLSLVMTAAQQRMAADVSGNGYMYGVVLQVEGVTAANAAATAFTEDGPWNALESVTLRDVSGEVINVTGFEARIAALADRQSQDDPASSTNANIYQAVTGAGATGGSFTFWLPVRVGINRRDLIGILGNQDRAQKYSLRHDIAPSASVYATAPTTLPTVTVNRYYEQYAVPNAVAPSGAPQQTTPDSYGTIHTLTASNSDTAPGPGRKTHTIQRIGNTIRWIALVFRAGSGATPRATADGYMAAGAGAAIDVKFGDDVQFSETYNYRRYLMRERWGFEFPAGVLVYDAVHDFTGLAGGEVGDDYWHTKQLTQAQFNITYPSTYVADANNTLDIIVDDMQWQAPTTVAPVSG